MLKQWRGPQASHKVSSWNSSHVERTGGLSNSACWFRKAKVKGVEKWMQEACLGFESLCLHSTLSLKYLFHICSVWHRW